MRTHRSWGWFIAACAIAVLAVTAACGGAERDTGDRPGATADERNEVGGLRPSGAPADGGTGPIAPAEGDDGASAGGDPDALQSTLDRKIIMTATLTITTDEVSKRFEDVGNIAAGAGGFVSSSSFGNAGEEQRASITIRVPGSAYQSVLKELRAIGDVQGEQSNANDVTEEYTDLRSRERNLVATEARYTELLAAAANINEILTVEDRLNATRAEIERVQGRIQLLDNQTDLATITVHLDPPLVSKADADSGGTPNPAEVAGDAFRASIAVLNGIAVVAVAVLAFSWWLAPLALLGFFLGRRQLRINRG